MSVEVGLTPGPAGCEILLHAAAADLLAARMAPRQLAAWLVEPAAVGSLARMGPWCEQAAKGLQNGTS